VNAGREKGGEGGEQGGETPRLDCTTGEASIVQSVRVCLRCNQTGLVGPGRLIRFSGAMNWFQEE